MTGRGASHHPQTLFTMELKHIEKIINSYNRLKHLDKEIIEFEKYAIKLANEDCKCSISIKMEFPNDVPKKEILDSDGSLITNRLSTDDPYKMFFTFGGLSSSDNDKNDNSKKLKSEILEVDALQIIGYLIEKKNIERKSLLNFISKTNG